MESLKGKVEHRESPPPHDCMPPRNSSAKRHVVSVPKRLWTKVMVDKLRSEDNPIIVDDPTIGRGVRVLILGAGAAGLSAGATLRRALPGASVVVIEARERIGGRILSAKLPADVSEHRRHSQQISLSGGSESADSPPHSSPQTSDDKGCFGNTAVEGVNPPCRPSNAVDVNLPSKESSLATPSLVPKHPAAAGAAAAGTAAAATAGGLGGGGGGEGRLALASGVCSIDLGAAYVHGCNPTNPVWRLAQCTNQQLDTRRGGYSAAWGERCVWRTRDGRVLGRSTLRRAFQIAELVGTDVEYPELGSSLAASKTGGKGVKPPRAGACGGSGPPGSSGVVGEGAVGAARFPRQAKNATPAQGEKGSPQPPQGQEPSDQAAAGGEGVNKRRKGGVGALRAAAQHTSSPDASKPATLCESFAAVAAAAAAGTLQRSAARRKRKEELRHPAGKEAATVGGSGHEPVTSPPTAAPTAAPASSPSSRSRREEAAKAELVEATLAVSKAQAAQAEASAHVTALSAAVQEVGAAWVGAGGCTGRAVEGGDLEEELSLFKEAFEDAQPPTKLQPDTNIHAVAAENNGNNNHDPPRGPAYSPPPLFSPPALRSQPASPLCAAELLLPPPNSPLPRQQLSVPGDHLIEAVDSEKVLLVVQGEEGGSNGSNTRSYVQSSNSSNNGGSTDNSGASSCRCDLNGSGGGEGNDGATTQEVAAADTSRGAEARQVLRLGFVKRDSLEEAATTETIALAALHSSELGLGAAKAEAVKALEEGVRRQAVCGESAKGALSRQRRAREELQSLSLSLDGGGDDDNGSGDSGDGDGDELASSSLGAAELVTGRHAAVLAEAPKEGEEELKKRRDETVVTPTTLSATASGALESPRSEAASASSSSLLLSMASSSSSSSSSLNFARGNSAGSSGSSGGESSSSSCRLRWQHIRKHGSSNGNAKKVGCDNSDEDDDHGGGGGDSDGADLNQGWGSDAGNDGAGGGSDGGEEGDVALRGLVEDAVAVRVARSNRTKPLGPDELDVLKSAQVLMWAYVAPLEKLGIASLRATTLPVQVLSKGSPGTRSTADTTSAPHSSPPHSSSLGKSGQRRNAVTSLGTDTTNVATSGGKRPSPHKGGGGGDLSRRSRQRTNENESEEEGGALANRGGENPNHSSDRQNRRGGSNRSQSPDQKQQPHQKGTRRTPSWRESSRAGAGSSNSSSDSDGRSSSGSSGGDDGDGLATTATTQPLLVLDATTVSSYGPPQARPSSSSPSPSLSSSSAHKGTQDVHLWHRKLSVATTKAPPPPTTATTSGSVRTSGRRTTTTTTRTPNAQQLESSNLGRSSGSGRSSGGEGGGGERKGRGSNSNSSSSGVRNSKKATSSAAPAAMSAADGLVSGGYFDLVPKQLAKGLDIRTGRVVTQVEWQQPGQQQGGEGQEKVAPVRVITRRLVPRPRPSPPLRKRKLPSLSSSLPPSFRGPVSSSDHHDKVNIKDEEDEEEEDGAASMADERSGVEDKDEEGSAYKEEYEDGEYAEGVVEEEDEIQEQQEEKQEQEQEVEVEEVFEADFVIVCLPLGVLKERHPTSRVHWLPALPLRKLEAWDAIGFGCENKVVLRFEAESVFWDIDQPYLQTVDPRFRILNGLCFGKGPTLVVHCSPPFGNGYDGLNDQGVVREVMECLRGMYQTQPHHAHTLAAAPSLTHRTRTPPRTHAAQTVTTTMLKAAVSGSDVSVLGGSSSVVSTGCSSNGGGEGATAVPGIETVGAAVATALPTPGKTPASPPAPLPAAAAAVPMPAAAPAPAALAVPLPALAPAPAPVASAVPAWPCFSFVTRWDSDPFSMGAYSYWKVGMELRHVLDAAKPEPELGGTAVARKSARRTAAKATATLPTETLVVPSLTARQQPHLSSGVLRPPRLFFAGEHATIRDAQCVHGATSSGERAARQVACAALGFLKDLERCVSGGEEFWFDPPQDMKELAIASSTAAAEAANANAAIAAAVGVALPLSSSPTASEARLSADSAATAALLAENVSAAAAQHQPAPALRVSSRQALKASSTPLSSSMSPPSSLPPSRLLSESSGSPSLSSLPAHVTGPAVLLDPKYSPFPTPEAVQWHKKGKWLFSCVCGLEAESFDDGKAMVECEACKAWQHEACVARYASTANAAASSFVAGGGEQGGGGLGGDGSGDDGHGHMCHRCEPTMYSSSSPAFRSNCRMGGGGDDDDDFLGGGDDDGGEGLFAVGAGAFESTLDPGLSSKLGKTSGGEVASLSGTTDVVLFPGGPAEAKQEILRLRREVTNTRQQLSQAAQAVMGMGWMTAKVKLESHETTSRKEAAPGVSPNQEQQTVEGSSFPDASEMDVSNVVVENQGDDLVIP